MESEGVGREDWLEWEELGETEGVRRWEWRESAAVRGRPPWISSAIVKSLGFSAIFVWREREGTKWV